MSRCHAVRCADHAHVVQHRAGRPLTEPQTARYLAAMLAAQSRPRAGWLKAAEAPSECGHIARPCLRGWYWRVFHVPQAFRAGLQGRSGSFQGAACGVQPKWLRIAGLVLRSTTHAIYATGILPVFAVRKAGFQADQVYDQPFATIEQKKALPRLRPELQKQPAQAGTSLKLS